MRAFAKTSIAIFMFSMSFALPAGAQQACPCIPLSNVWVVKSCDTWNCAAASLIMANGDPYTVSLSTGNTDHPWVIVRRIVTGTATDSSDDPYQLDAFDHATEAMSHFSAMPDSARPIMVSAPDGKMLILSLRADSQKRRAVTH